LLAWLSAAIGLLGGCVDLTPPWERPSNQDAGLPAGSGGGFVPADANGAGGAGGNGPPIEGWPTTDVPLSDGIDGSGFRGEAAPPGVLDVGTLDADAPGADAADGLVGGEAGGARDNAPAETDNDGTDAERDLPVVGSGGTGGSFLDASSDDASGGGGGSGGATGGSGGTSEFDGGEAGATGAGGHTGTGGTATGGTATGGTATGATATGGAPGTGGAATGGSATGGAATGGTETGGSATGGAATGGSATGGSATGGTETGGSATGGTATGGAATGGSATGGAATGGNATGGATGGGGSPACAGHVGVDAGSGGSAGLVAWYRCESAVGASGTELNDDSNNGHNGTLHTGAGGAVGYRFETNTRLGGNALFFVAAQQGYVTLPEGLLAGACEFTIATWVYLNTSQTWQRIFDFGRDTTVYMFLTPKNGSNNRLRFAITVGGNGNAEQVIDGPAELPTGEWHHVAVVLGPSGGVLYLDGVSVGSNPTMTLRPADLGTLPNLYIGRSQWSVDPYLDGDVDSFRIYDRALSAADINALYTGT
jgi:hypothetical protein